VLVKFLRSKSFATKLSQYGTPLANRCRPVTAPGTPQSPVEITDPRAMRALAHPARLAILQHLALEGPATATECAEVAGLSPSACSYHLRALAGHGFVEEDLSSAADGRHRPWRARVVSMTLGRGPGQPTAARAAGRLLTESMQARIDEVRNHYLSREADYPTEWQASAGLYQDVVHVTAGEFAALREEMQGVLVKYRRLSAADRPPCARRVHASFDLIPWFAPGAVP
jgi:DNA-binding transcriptional ArsR family regulator